MQTCADGNALSGTRVDRQVSKGPRGLLSRVCRSSASFSNDFVCRTVANSKIPTTTAAIFPVVQRS